MNRKGLILITLGLIALLIPQYLKQRKKVESKSTTTDEDPAVDNNNNSDVSAKIKPGTMDNVDFSEKTDPVINNSNGVDIYDLEKIKDFSIEYWRNKELVEKKEYPREELNPNTGDFEYYNPLPVPDDLLKQKYLSKE